MSNPATPRTPLRSLHPEDVRKTPGGLSLDIVLTPALRPAPRSACKSLTSSPITSADISEKLSNAAIRREEVLQLRKENIDEKLAMVQNKKDEIVKEKATKTKEELDAKLKDSEDNKNFILKKTKDDVKAHLAKVEQKMKDLEVLTEAEKIARKLALDADIMKADENRSEQLEKRIKDIQEHVDYVKSVSATQEMKKKLYLAGLEKSLEKAGKRKEEAVAKVVEVAKEEEVKVEEAKLRREKDEKAIQDKVKAALNEKSGKVVENQANKDEMFKSKMEERNRRAELVRQNKLRLEQEGVEGTNLGPESA
eukprot:GFUD01009204.1.p1 GENE.GFUD01009204.1~~GFUD01009204.1.p1  ORF type:complete len:328 (+),score=171.78 GFUD01009204.1:58-984(+)